MKGDLRNIMSPYNFFESENAILEEMLTTSRELDDDQGLEEPTRQSFKYRNNPECILFEDMATTTIG